MVSSMKLGIIVSEADPEKAWNALRFGVTAVGEGHEVSIFLLGAGVEIEMIEDEVFDVKRQITNFVSQGGSILACGTCLDLRGSEGSETCRISGMSDMLELVKNSDKILTYG